MNEHIIIIPWAAKQCSHCHLTALSHHLHSESRIFLLGEVNNLLILWNFNLSKRPLSTLNTPTCLEWSQRALGVQLSNFWPFSHFSIICRVWLTVINTWYFLPSEGDRVISSTLVQGRKKMNSVFSSSMEPFVFYKLLLVSICETTQSLSVQSLRWSINCCSWTSWALNASPQVFIYVSSYWCLSTVTLET